MWRYSVRLEGFHYLFASNPSLILSVIIDTYDPVCKLHADDKERAL